MMSDTQATETAAVAMGVHNYSEEDSYVRPDDPRILKRLEWFQDQKLGFMMHWGPYSQLGIVESWALSDADADWARGGIDWDIDGESFKQQYRDLNRTFNPVRFQPNMWAQLAKESGFKYLLFTTKHHDGFCMWDTQYSDYKITAPDCPFHTHRYADICKHLFEAFRKQGMGIAAYFSKADWHVPSYWAPDTPNGRFMRRGPSYDPKVYPERWEEFVQFTHNQVLELLRNYGRIDSLWFDAGWVCTQANQDIRIEELIEKARRIQPWVLSADRTVGGPCENYVTPEQTVPVKPLSIPWESCVTMGHSFSFAYEDEYKSARQLVNLLVDIVCKGGNLALNVGPQPDGRLPRGAIKSMKELGAWLNVYGEAIYGTRVCAPYRTGRFGFTKKDGKRYAIYLHDEKTAMPETITIPYHEEVRTLTDLETGETLPFMRDADGITVSLRKRDASRIADVFSME